MSIKWKKVIALIVAIILSAGSIMQTVAATPTEVENEVEVTDTPENGEKENITEDNQELGKDDSNVLDNQEEDKPFEDNSELSNNAKSQKQKNRLSVENESPFSGGNGTEESPYLISSDEELLAFAEVVNNQEGEYQTAHFALAKNIYLNDITDYDEWDKTAPKNEWPGVENFFGTFDGKQHTIYGLYMNSDSDRVGLFNSIEVYNWIDRKLVIKNLQLKNIYIKGQSYVGGLVGYAYCKVEITNCNVEGEVIGENSDIGGIGGFFSSGGNKGLTLTSVTNRAKVSGRTRTGGIWGGASIGNNLGSDTSGGGSEKIILKNCNNYGDILGTVSYTGGIIGQLRINLNCNGFDIERTQNFGTVTGKESTGGICGCIDVVAADSISASLEEICNEGNVFGEDCVGGICGEAALDRGDGYFRNVYNIGKIQGSSCVGGIIGVSTRFDVNSSYNVGIVTAETKVASLVGWANLYLGDIETVKVNNCYYAKGTAEVDTDGSASGVLELSEEEFKLESNFSGFDFVDIWKMGEKYPIFIWQDGNGSGNQETSKTDQFIIEKVKEYTSDAVYAQWEEISNSEISEETKFQRYTELFNQYGFLDAKEGIQYLSKTTNERYAYLTLTTDETYCAYNFYDWLHNTGKGAVARGLLIADGLIFNNELSDWTDLSTYIEGDYPGVVKYQDMLYDFMETASFDVEKMTYISDVSKLSGTVTEAGKVYADQLIKKLNECKNRNELRKALRSNEAIGVYSDVKTQGSDLNSFKLSFTLDETSGFGQFYKAMGYATKTLDIVDMSIQHVEDIIQLDSKLQVYEQYRTFLNEVELALDLPLEMRLAAKKILRDMKEGTWGELTDFAMDIVDKTSVKAKISDAILKAAIGQTGAATLNEFLLVLKIEAYFVNRIMDVGKLVQGVAYVEGYSTLSSHYREKLEESKKNFLTDQSAENAWDFYDNYSLLYMLRVKGEEAYLNMCKVEGLINIFTDCGYSEKEEVVKETIQTLEERCFFNLEEGIEIPESVQFALKSVISCPVDVSVYAPDGTLVAKLRDGEENNISNEYGQFSVVYRPYSGEYAKVLCFYKDADYKLEIAGVDKGLVSFELAEEKEGEITTYSFENQGIEAGNILRTSIEQIRGDGTVELDIDGNGVTENTIYLNKNPEETYRPVESLELKETFLILETGGSALMEVKISPDEATRQQVFWLTGDENIARVEEGKVSAISKGTTNIYCVSQDNRDQMAVCKVIVRSKGACTHPLEKVDEKKPDSEHTGNIEYWYCPECDRYYEDENGMIETSLEKVTLSKLSSQEGMGTNPDEQDNSADSEGMREQQQTPDTGDKGVEIWLLVCALSGIIIAGIGTGKMWRRHEK
ncbi:hypothetical protein FND36_09590 [Lachnospiraceae bacterium KGMB03038]|nr:hypothetical protein FND36_09590 [Lachnospiraceae bacterium KGMB03038]